MPEPETDRSKLDDEALADRRFVVRFQAKLVHLAAAFGLVFSTGTLVVVCITLHRFDADIKKKMGGEPPGFIESALAFERQLMTLMLVLLLSVTTINFYAAIRLNKVS